MDKALEKGHLLFLSATVATDVYCLCRKAMERKEDAVVEQIATLLQADCILGRNASDIKKSSHRVLTLPEFIAEL